MWISTKVPIPWAPVPAIDSRLEITADCGGLTLDYTSDEFPSHGVLVAQDGTVRLTKVLFDASSVPVEETLAEIFILEGLTSFSNSGTVRVLAFGAPAACAPRELPEVVPP